MKKESTRAIQVGAGVVTAAALAAAAAYWISEKATPAQKAKAKAWVVKTKADIIRHAKTARRFGEKEYKQVIDQAVKKYGPLESIGAGDIAKAARDLKAEWQRIKAHAEKMSKGTAKKASPKRKAKAKRKTKAAK